MLKVLPKKLQYRCCKLKTRHDMALEKAQQALEAEINMTDIVTQIRYFKLALKHLLSQSDETKFLELSKTVYIDVDYPDEVDNPRNDNS